MAAVNILALVVAVLLLACVFREKIVDVLPAAVCILILMLFVLGLIRHLSWIDFIGIGFMAGVCVWLAVQRRAVIRQAGKYLLKECRDPGAIVVLITLLVISYCVRNKMVIWWDDLNYWATDAKALFFLDGFAGTHRNVAPEFGDYPPGTQMLKWWFLHLSPEQFREGLLFSGYYFMNVIFMAPLLRFLQGTKSGSYTVVDTIKKYMIWILCGIALWCFPNVAEAFYLDGTCADLTAGLIYGAFLAGVSDREGHSPLFYYGRMALYLMVLVLTKNMAFIWVGFGLLYALGYHLYNKMSLRRWLAVFLLTVLSGGTWLAFCLWFRRIAKLTGAAVSMASSGIVFPDHGKELIQSYVTAFLFYPLHLADTVLLDLTPLGACLVIILLFAILIWRKKIAVENGIRTGLFLVISGLLYYIILLVCHLTIFAQETQYLNPFGMISSIERYAAPFTLGSLYLAAYFFLRSSEKKYRMYLICFVFIMLTIDPQGVYRGLMGYQERLVEYESTRREWMDADANRLLQAVDEAGLEEARVLYLKDIDEVNWVQHAYLGFMASPISLMTDYIDGDAVSLEIIQKAITASHADYIYVNQMGKSCLAVLADMTEEIRFDYWHLYRIHRSGETMRLDRVE